MEIKNVKIEVKEADEEYIVHKVTIPSCLKRSDVVFSTDVFSDCVWIYIKDTEGRDIGQVKIYCDKNRRTEEQEMDLVIKVYSKL